MDLLENIAVSEQPYPGLRPFRRHEAEIFFGRDTQIDQLLAKLAASRFVGVVGTSGCGKSSLVHAGLIPALELGLMGRGRSRWRVATMRPGNRPMRNLADALGKPDVLGSILPAPLLLAALGNGPRGLADALAAAAVAGEVVLAPGENLLLVVDQFEEIFRFRQAGEPDARRARRSSSETATPRRAAIRRRRSASRPTPSLPSCSRRPSWPGRVRSRSTSS